MAERANTGYATGPNAAARTERATKFVQRTSRETHNVTVPALPMRAGAGIDTATWPVKVTGSLSGGLHDGVILFADTSTVPPSWPSTLPGGSLLEIKILPFPGASLEIGDMGNARLVGETPDHHAVYALVGDTTGGGSFGSGSGSSGSGSGSDGGLVCSGYVGSWTDTYLSPCVEGHRTIFTRLISLYLIDGCLQLKKGSESALDECCTECGSGSGSGSGSGGGTTDCETCPDGAPASWIMDLLASGIWEPLSGTWNLDHVSGCTWTTGDAKPSWTLTYDADSGVWRLTGRIQHGDVIWLVVYESTDFDCCTGGIFGLVFQTHLGAPGSVPANITLIADSDCAPGGSGGGGAPGCCDFASTITATLNSAACAGVDGVTKTLTLSMGFWQWSDPSGSGFRVTGISATCTDGTWVFSVGGVCADGASPWHVTWAGTPTGDCATPTVIATGAVSAGALCCNGAAVTLTLTA